MMPPFALLHALFPSDAALAWVVLFVVGGGGTAGVSLTIATLGLERRLGRLPAFSITSVLAVAAGAITHVAFHEGLFTAMALAAAVGGIVTAAFALALWPAGHAPWRAALLGGCVSCGAVVLLLVVAFTAF